MAKDSTIYVRRAVVSTLKVAAAVSAIVADRVYGMKAPADPTWPWVRCQIITTAPERATGLDGSSLSFQVSGFAKGDDEAGCAILAQAIGSALDGLSVPLSDAPWPARLTNIAWDGTQIIRDSEEADGYHAIVSFTGTVTS